MKNIFKLTETDKIVVEYRFIVEKLKKIKNVLIIKVNFTLCRKNCNLLFKLTN